MPEEVLYRKWRPRTFAEVVGQDHIIRTLTNAVAGGKVAHAYLFSGPRGTGKTSTGRLLAKAVNCVQPAGGEPCNTCASCLAHLEGRAIDLVELDAASNRGIDEIRGIREKANYAPAVGRYKVYLVDEVHMLTEPAFNALLKTLEEPPPHIIFILATTEFHKVPATIVSRCQRFDFRRVPLAATTELLARIAAEEKVACPREGLELIARASTGSLRDAINLLEQLVDHYGAAMTLEDVRTDLGLVGDARAGELARFAIHADLAPGLRLIAAARDDGLDLRRFQREVVARLRDYLLVKSGVTASQDWTEEEAVELQGQVADVPAERIVRALRAFGQADLRSDPLSPLPLELALAECTLALPEETPADGARRPRSTMEPVAARPAPAPPTRSARRPTPVPSAPAQVGDGGRPETPPVRPAPSGLTVEDIRARWAQLYQEGRKIGQETHDPAFSAASGYLNSGCDVTAVQDGEVVIGFRYQIHLDKVNDPNVSRAMQQIFDRVLGAGLKVRCVLAPELPERRRGGHLVEAAREAGAVPISDEDEAVR